MLWVATSPLSAGAIKRRSGAWAAWEMAGSPRSPEEAVPQELRGTQRSPRAKAPAGPAPTASPAVLDVRPGAQKKVKKVLDLQVQNHGSGEDLDQGYPPARTPS